MATWYTAAQNIAASHIQPEILNPPREVVRADGRFPYRPGIVCPRPQRKYEAQIGLKTMERQAARTAPEQRAVLAKRRLEVLASRAQSHFAHLGSPFAVATCVLCRTSTAGRAVLEWALTQMLMNTWAAYPVNRPMSTSGTQSTPSSQTPGSPRDDSRKNIAEGTSNTSAGGDMRSQMMYRDDLWAPTARPPLLPDRDAVATNAWHEVSLGVSRGASGRRGGRESHMAAWNFWL